MQKSSTFKGHGGSEKIRQYAIQFHVTIAKVAPKVNCSNACRTVPPLDGTAFFHFDHFARETAN
jgi:hypothetical protein